MLCCTGYQLQEKQSYLHLLLSRNVDAVLLIGSHFIENSPEENRYILDAASKIPVFILNGELKGENIYSILCDDYMALKDMTDLIFSNGATSPIYLYRTLNYSGQKKVKGFLDSCSEHGLDISKKLRFPHPATCTKHVPSWNNSMQTAHLSTVYWLQMMNWLPAL